MSRRQWLLLALALVLTGVLVALVDPPEAGPTTYGAQPEGLLSAHDYLEARGFDLHRWEQPLDELPQADGTLLVAAPLALPWTESDTRAVRRWASQGGTVVLLASGGEPSASEGALLDSFGISVGPRREDAPLGWSAWQAWREAEVEVSPEVGAESWPDQVQLRRETHGPRAPEGAQLVYTNEEGAGLLWIMPWPPGQVVVLANSSPLSNAGLERSNNLALLEQLASLDPPLRIDERHHGHLAAQARALSSVLGPFELLLAHVLLLYLLAAWTISRPFGPAMAPEADRRGSVSRDLLALARLHRRSGHAQQAGQRLLQLARDLARRRGSRAEELPERFEGGESELIELARTVGRLQSEGRL